MAGRSGIINSTLMPYSGKPVYDASLNMKYSFSKHLWSQAGLGYYNSGYQLEGMVFPDGIDTVSGSHSTTTIKYDLNYLEVPLQVLYNPGQKRVCFIGGAGFSPVFLFKARESATQTGQPESAEVARINANGSDVSSRYNKFGLLLSVSAGMDVNISKRISCVADIVFRDGLIKASKSMDFHLADLGLRAGLYYRLNSL